MTQEQFEVRKERAERDVFVITAAEEGWRVRSARNPSRFYVVSGDGADVRCSCPDFQAHAAEDPTWRCKHVLAVLNHRARAGAANSETERELSEERAAIQAETANHDQPANGEPSAAQMLIKRSLSPDGRIDSISIEFAFDLANSAVGQIRDRAAKTLKLQTEIVKSFLSGANARRGSNRANQTQVNNKANGATFARLLDVGVTNGQYGERFYLNVQVNGRTARFFGTADQIAKAISTAGERVYATAIEPGMRLNLPCRVLTERSRDGRYLNVTRVLPPARQGNSGARQ